MRPPRHLLLLAMLTFAVATDGQAKLVVARGTPDVAPARSLLSRLSTSLARSVRDAQKTLPQQTTGRAVVFIPLVPAALQPIRPLNSLLLNLPPPTTA